MNSSIDDHIIEPPNVWTDRIPSKYADVMPRSIRMRGTMNFIGGVFSFEEDDSGDEADWWQYEDGRYPLTRLECAVGFDRSEVTVSGITYEGMRKGCWAPGARLEDMDANWTEASMSFPSSFPRFCGQTFSETPDKFDPRDYLKPARAAMQKVCEERMRQFGQAGRAKDVPIVSLAQMATAYSAGKYGDAARPDEAWRNAR